MQLLFVLTARSGLQLAATQTPVEPKPRSYRQGTTSAVLIEGQQEMNRMHQMRPLLQQAPPFHQRLPHQPQLGMLQISQSAVNDASRPTGRPSREVVLFNQQSTAPGTRTFAGNGDPVNSAANNDHLEALAFQRPTNGRLVAHSGKCRSLMAPFKNKPAPACDSRKDNKSSELAELRAQQPPQVRTT